MLHAEDLDWFYLKLVIWHLLNFKQAYFFLPKVYRSEQRNISLVSIHFQPSIATVILHRG